MGLRRLVAVAALLATPWVVAWTCYDPVEARARRLVDHCPSVARTKAQNFDTVAKWVRDEYLRGVGKAARGAHPPARAVLLAHGPQLRMAKAVMNKDARDEAIVLEHAH